MNTAPPTETVLEIDLPAIEHNYTYLRSHISENTKLMAVVKAFAYGSEAVAIAQKLENMGADYIAVAYTAEGISLRKNGIQAPILVLHPQSVHFKEIIEHRLTPSIYSQYVMKMFREIATTLHQQDYPIHLKLNTGLNRLGFGPHELTDVIKQLRQTSAIRVDGIFSHLAASEDMAEKEFTQLQIQRFVEMSNHIMRALPYRPIRHLCNTSGILNYPKAHFDMVRSGIGLYGYSNSEEKDLQLIPAATLKTIISQIHTLKPGETVSYNRKFQAKTTLRTATLPLGHADGINRIYGLQKGDVLINGKRAPIIGNVCMDMMMVNITDIACQEGDEVIVFAKGKSAEELAHKAGTISYELITSISQRVKRKVIL